MNIRTSMDVEDANSRIAKLKQINKEQTTEIVQLRKKLKAKCPPPPALPDPPRTLQLATVNALFILLENMTKENTGLHRVVSRYTISDVPLRADAAVLLSRVRKDLGK